MPSKIGPLRTSTVILILLFLGVLALYVLVAPPSKQAAGQSPDTGTSSSPSPTPSPSPSPTASATRRAAVG